MRRCLRSVVDLRLFYWACGKSLSGLGGFFNVEICLEKWRRRADFDKIVSRGTLIIENEKSVFYNFDGFLRFLL